MSSAYWNQWKGKWYAAFKNAQGRDVCVPIKGQVKRAGPNPPSGRGSLTRKQAEAKAAEMEREADELRRGVRKEEKNETFDWMVSFHWEIYGCKLKSTAMEQFYSKHLRDCSLSKMRMRDIRIDHIREFLESKKNSLGPKSRNDLRTRIYQLIRLAAEKELCNLHITKVQKARVPKTTKEYLRFYEVEPTFNQLRPDDQGLFWFYVSLGFRRKDPLNMLKSDVNRAERTVVADETKTGDQHMLPIPAALWPIIEKQLRTPGPFLFPDPKKNGGRYAEKPKFDRLLRTAMGKAGIVTGYRHLCRRKGCGFKDVRQDSGDGRCPKCHFRLSVYGIPRHVRFHDLRRTTGTLLSQMGEPIRTISKILGHADIQTTIRYLEVDMEEMRGSLSKLSGRLAGLPADEPTRVESARPLQRVAGVSTQFSSLILPGTTDPQSEGRSPSGNPLETAAFLQSGRQDLNLRPLGPEADSVGYPALAPIRNHSDSLQQRQTTIGHRHPGIAGFSTGFSSLILPDIGDNLLTVKQVATTLNVCAATVYALCERGELAHTRVSNAIRVHPEQLRDFLNRSSATKPKGE